MLMLPLSNQKIIEFISTMPLVIMQTRPIRQNESQAE